MIEGQSYGPLVLTALAGAGAAWLAALVINLVVFAPFKAYRRLVAPLRITTANDPRAPGFLSNQKFTMQNATLLIENRSDRDVLDCSLRLLGIEDADEGQFPRLIGKFDIPAKGTRRVPVAYWTIRTPPYEDDAEIRIVEPPAGGFFSGVRPPSGADLRATLELDSPSLPIRRLSLRVWLDRSERRLRTEMAAT